MNRIILAEGGGRREKMPHADYADYADKKKRIGRG